MPEIAEPIVTEHAGIVFPGRQAVGTILQELERQKKARRDVVLSSDKLKVQYRDKQLLLRVPLKEGPELVGITKRVFVQLAQWMGLRMTDRFYKWLGVHPDIWADLVNKFFDAQKENRMVRLMAMPDGAPYCRALLSDKYRVIDNAGFFYSIAERLQEVKAEIWHARLSEDNFYGYAVSPGITGQVSTDRTFDPGDGWRSRWYGKEGDVFNAALAFGNSETGSGGCFLNSAILRRVCENYCVWHNVVSKTHIGRRTGMELMLSEETIMKQNEVFFLEIRDHVKNVFTPAEFQKIVDAMAGATKEEIPDPEKAAEALQLNFDLSEERKAAIRNLFIKNQDASRYGLAQAVNEYAHSSGLDPDVGFELEKLSGELVRTPMTALYKEADAIKSTRKDSERRAPALTGDRGMDV